MPVLAEEGFEFRLRAKKGSNVIDYPPDSQIPAIKAEVEKAVRC